MLLDARDKITETLGFRTRSLRKNIGSGGTQDLHVVDYLGFLALGWITLNIVVVVSPIIVRLCPITPLVEICSTGYRFFFG